jgi:glycosyltransferase involved in cell wall biosynthesis
MKAFLKRVTRSVFTPHPVLSIVVVVFNMQREATRTLHSLSRDYQIGVSENDYEVIVVDNGSVPPLSMDGAVGMAGNVRYFYIDDASPSPAGAMNFGVAQSRGRYVATVIDGARLLSPGVIQYGLRAFQAFRDPVVTVPAWHLGPDIQRHRVKHGYDRAVEDDLLSGIGWPRNGYRLFEISTLGGSCIDGWFRPMAESSCLFASRADYEAVGGYDERFRAPGGGLVSHDLYRRLCSLDGKDLVVLLGEGTFHQLHGGVATNAPEGEFELRYRLWLDEYQALRGEPYSRPQKAAHFLGHIPPQANRFLSFSAERLLAGEPARAPDTPRPSSPPA